MKSLDHYTEHYQEYHQIKISNNNILVMGLIKDHWDSIKHKLLLIYKANLSKHHKTNHLIRSKYNQNQLYKANHQNKVRNLKMGQLQSKPMTN